MTGSAHLFATYMRCDRRRVNARFETLKEKERERKSRAKITLYFIKKISKPQNRDRKFLKFLFKVKKEIFIF